MGLGGGLTVFIGVALAATAGCGSDDSSSGSAGTGGGGSTTSMTGGAAGSGGLTGSGGTGSSDCSRFGFVASGKSCASTGCSSFACTCPGDWPKSIAACTTAGCLVAGDCSAICAEDLGAALDCTDTYTIAPDAGGEVSDGSTDSG